MVNVTKYAPKIFGDIILMENQYIFYDRSLGYFLVQEAIPFWSLFVQRPVVLEFTNHVGSKFKNVPKITNVKSHGGECLANVADRYILVHMGSASGVAKFEHSSNCLVALGQMPKWNRLGWFEDVPTKEALEQVSSRLLNWPKELKFFI